METLTFIRLNKQRLDLYDEASKMPVDRITKVYFSLVKSDITRDVVLFKLRKDFDQQVSEIISRLDIIDINIKSLKERLDNLNK